MLRIIIITASSPDNGEKMRILIVEDDPLVALALKMFLIELGHTVVGTAADTIGAVRVVEDGVNANLAIVDLYLARGSSGIETAVQIHHLSGVASVFLTCDAEGARAGRHAALGCLAKPLSGRKLATALNAIEALVQGRNVNDVPAELELFSVNPLTLCLESFHRDDQRE
jgi:two-component system, response regulator PdtaR